MYTHDLAVDCATGEMSCLEPKPESWGERYDVQDDKAAQGKESTSSSESFTIRGSWVGILVGKTKKKRRLERVVKESDSQSRNKNKRKGRYNIDAELGVSDA
jgi:hypothetical protein